MLRSPRLRKKCLKRTVSSMGLSSRSVSYSISWPKRPDVSLSMREVEAPASARTKHLIIVGALGVIVRRPVSVLVGALSPVHVRGRLQAE